MVSARLAVLALAPLASAQEPERQGEEKQCIGPQMHKIDYDMRDFDQDGQPQDFSINIAPDPENSHLCPPPNGGGTEKDVCVGINTENCKGAAETFGINDFLDCTNCYMGLTADLYYDLQVKAGGLKKVSVGLSNAHLRGAAEVTAKQGASMEVLSGSIPILTREMKAKIDFLIADIIPIDITIMVPTELEYSLKLSESAQLTLGGNLDVNLGDYELSWEDGPGFTTKAGPVAAPAFTPVIKGEAKVEADAPLTLKSTVAIEFEKVLGYNLHVTPSLPLHASVSMPDVTNPTHLHLCANGDFDFSLTHDADVHFDMGSYHKQIATFGPAEIYSHHWDKVFDMCYDTPEAVVV